MDDDGNGKSIITDEIVFLWDGYTYIYAVSSMPVDSLEQSGNA